MFKGPRVRILERDEWYCGLPCAAGTEADDFLNAGTLAKDYVYKGLPLPKGTTFCTDDYGIFEAKVAAPTEVHGVKVPAGSTLSVPNARFSLIAIAVLNLFEPMEVIALALLLLFSPLILLELIVTGLWPRRTPPVNISSEQLLRLRVGSTEFTGVRTVELARFRIRGLTLGEPFMFGSDLLESGHLSFDRKGNVRAITFYRLQLFRGLPVYGRGLIRTEMRLWPNGRIRSLVLGADHHIEGRQFFKGERVFFSQGGKVTSSKKLSLPKDNEVLYSPRPDRMQANIPKPPEQGQPRDT